jgi:hypothetical protein
MITLCIRYTIDANKLAHFEAYARTLPRPIEHCGGKLAGYYLPTKFAGPTNAAMGLIDFSSPPTSNIARGSPPTRTESRQRAGSTPPAASSTKTAPSCSGSN